MGISTQLRDAARYMKRYGFSTHLGRNGGCRCFCGALESVGGGYDEGDYESGLVGGPAANFLSDMLQINVRPEALLAQGWRKRDAIAALEIAADIAEADGK